MTGSVVLAEQGKVYSLLKKSCFPLVSTGYYCSTGLTFIQKNRMCTSLNKEDTQFLEIYL